MTVRDRIGIMVQTLDFRARDLHQFQTKQRAREAARKMRSHHIGKAINADTKINSQPTNQTEKD